jgi:chromosomal replication initiation ATPase DnaA
MSYAETQAEIISAELCGRTLAATPRPDDDAVADLAAAVAAARRLRFMTEVREIVDAAGLTVEQLRGHDKRRELMELRRIVATYLRRRGCSLSEIGRVLNRDHTSVLNLLRTRAPVVSPHEELAS